MLCRNPRRQFCCVEANISILNEQQINSLLLGNISCLCGRLLTIFKIDYKISQKVFIILSCLFLAAL